VRAEKKVYDVTATNRNEVEDAKDPGGRIGPYIDQGNPDLRNLDGSSYYPPSDVATSLTLLLLIPQNSMLPSLQ
jgi:hypothetical protein